MVDNRETCGADTVMRGAMRSDDTVAQKFNTECSLESRRQTLQELGQRATGGAGQTRMMLGNLLIEGDLSHAKINHLGKTNERPPAAAPRETEAPRQAPRVGEEWQYASPENLAAGRRLTGELLKGHDISKQLNEMTPLERRSAMMVVKHELAEKSGDNVTVTRLGSGPEATNMINFKTKDGVKVLLTESSMGSPQDIVVNTGRSLTNPLATSSDVYNRPGETAGRGDAASNGPSLLERLAPGNLADGKGPLAKAIRGEELTPDEQRQLEELSKKPGSKIQFYKPKGAD